VTRIQQLPYARFGLVEIPTLPFLEARFRWAPAVREDRVQRGLSNEIFEFESLGVNQPHDVVCFDRVLFPMFRCWCRFREQLGNRQKMTAGASGLGLQAALA